MIRFGKNDKRISNIFKESNNKIPEKLKKEILNVDYKMLFAVQKNGEEFFVIGTDEEIEKYIDTYPDAVADVQIRHEKQGKYLMDCVTFHDLTNEWHMTAKIMGDLIIPYARYEYPVIDSKIMHEAEDILTELKESDNVFYWFFANMCEYALSHRLMLRMKLFESVSGMENTIFRTDYKDVDLMAASKQRIKWFKEKNEELEASLDEAEDDVERKQIIALIEKNREMISQERYDEVLADASIQEVRRLRKCENNYEIGIIGGWISNHSRILYKGTYYSDGTIIVVNDPDSMHSQMKFACDKAMEHKAYIKHCSQCGKLIYTKKTRYPIFCSDDCKKIYGKEYYDSHQAIYRQNKPAEGSYQNLCKMMLRHIAGCEDPVTKEKLQSFYDEFRKIAKPKKKDANKGAKIKEFDAWCHEQREKFKDLE